MSYDRQITAAKSCARASLLALIAIMIWPPGNILAAPDAPQRSRPKAQHQRTQPASAPAQQRADDSKAPPPAETPAIVVPDRPAAIVLDPREASGVLGDEVRSAADENMGRIVDVLVDQSGKVRAAIIDFGGFLGVGSRKIAVDWNALRFSPSQERNRVILEMTRDQVKAVPEFQGGKPIFILGAVAGPDRVRFTTENPGR